MPLVLALEPDPRQASALKPIVERRVGAQLILADSKDSAMAELNERIPDVLLLTALLSPRDEAELNDHLRTLEGAGHVQTLTIPLLGSPTKPKKRGLLSALRGETDKTPTAGCEPSVFAEQIRSYLEHAEQLKAELAAAPKRKLVEDDAASSGANDPDSSWGSSDGSDDSVREPSDTTSTGARASSSYWDWDAPPARAAEPAARPRPADALFQFEDTRTGAEADDPDSIPLRLDQHASGVLDAGDILLQQPAQADPESPAASLDALAGPGLEEAPVDEGATPRSRRRKKTRLPRPAVTEDAVEEPSSTESPDDIVRQEQREREAEELERLGREQQAAEEAERERLAREAEEQERLAREAEEIERLAREEAERERLAREAEEQARLAREAEERERLARETEELERLAREAEEQARLAREAAAREAEERERLAREEAARERAERERLAREAEERERLAREAQERERLAREEAARERRERERLAREAAERERLARESERREQLAKLEAARERLERERVAREAAERERLAREAAERERLERERLAREAEERERARQAEERERRAREEAERERLERERLAREAEERERLEREFAERERLAREEAARERAERERLAREAEERERVAREEAARERAERERLQQEAARERAERERLAREAEERERLAREEAASERAERERLTQEAEQWARLSREQADRERAQREEAAQAQTARAAREDADRHPERPQTDSRQPAPANQAPQHTDAGGDADRDRFVRELAAQAQALAEAVKAAQQLQAAQLAAAQKPPRLRRARPTRASKKSTKSRKPVNGQLQDEWGLYDPQVCGFDALYARLQEDEDPSQQPEEKPSATELLMRAATRERNGRKGARPRGPAPLAVWARREADPSSQAPAVNGEQHANGFTELRETSAILGCLNLPPTVAAVTYAGGCRIGKVKVKSASRKRQPNGKGARKTAGKGKKEAPEPLIILSRKLLDQLRGT